MTGAGVAVGIAAVDPGIARDHAARILAERRFHGAPAPRPLHEVFAAIGDAVNFLTDPIGRLIDGLARGVPGGAAVLWLLIAGAVVAAAATLTARTVRRRGAAVERLRGASVGSAAGDDPRELERRADEAERAGDLDHAVRLRFRAGLLRLDGARAIELRPSTTTTDVSAALRSKTFDELALTFEEVAYGGRRARTPDMEAARREWPALLAELSTR